MFSPHYRDFYQKALVPIGENDQHYLSLCPLFNSKSPNNYTHWLIALEGEPVNAPKEYYHWKILIYPCNDQGTFQYQNPFYVSYPYDQMNAAFDALNEMENCSRKDELCSSSLIEKIS